MILGSTASRSHQWL